MVTVLSHTNSILNQYISEIRDAEVQKDSMRFRRNLERIGEIFAVHLSRELAYETREVTTPLGIANVPMLVEYPVLATILRAGLPFHQGLLNIFDKSESGFISAYRKYEKNGSFSIHMQYASVTETENKVVILSDTMLASGSSMTLAYRDLVTNGKPKHTYITAILASVEGIEKVKRSVPHDEVSLIVGVVDDEMTAQSYIVPGLGDAGDLAFGKKH